MQISIIERTDYLKKLSEFRDHTEFIKVITGVRRCGKSTLLSQFIQQLRGEGVPDNEIVCYNFELFEYSDIEDHKQLNDLLIRNVPKNGRCYVFLDEIQRVDGWERSVNSLNTETDADIYITGSNAHMLSSDLATYLTGRYVSFEMFPLSFREYMELRGTDQDGNERRVENVLSDFIKYGGFPAIDPRQSQMMVTSALSDLHNSIIYQDILSRGGIRKTAELEKIVRYIMYNIGNPISVKRISDELSVDRSTVDSYLMLLDQACLIYRADRFDIRSTSLSPTPKYYAVDQGLRNLSIGFRDLDKGRILENIVFIELMRRGYKVQVGTWKSKEVDFVAESLNGERTYFQACLAFTEDDVKERELSSLRSINDNCRKIVLVMNEISNVTSDGIIIKNLTEWLLDEN